MNVLKAIILGYIQAKVHKMKKIHSNRSQSEVITSVLLILVVITSIVIVTNFVVPFVKKQLSGSDCFDVADKIEVTSSDRYTCYNENTGTVSVQIHLGDISDKISGFSIVLGGASTKNYKISNGTATSGVVMYRGGAGLNLEVPGKNEERTYNFTGITSKPDKINVYPILKDGRICDSATGGVNNVDMCDS
jgi:flagellin-like protein